MGRVSVLGELHLVEMEESDEMEKKAVEATNSRSTVSNRVTASVSSNSRGLTVQP